MQMHEPLGYNCPFCNIVEGGEDPQTLVWQDEICVGTVALHRKQNHGGSLLLFPRVHHENLYVLPDALGAHMFEVTKFLALSLKAALHCDGITIRQNNEPAGGQDVWHYHVHIIPRYIDDGFNNKASEIMPLLERRELARQVQVALRAA
jgi:histidine triad (HIT) family protein